MKHALEGKLTVFFTLLWPPPILTCSISLLSVPRTGAKVSLSLMIESPNPVAMRVSLYSTHTRLQSTECEAFLPSHVGEGACTSGGHTTCHPLLMDERHYSSWGQVPPTIKGPSQWLRKHGSERGGGRKLLLQNG